MPVAEKARSDKISNAVSNALEQEMSLFRYEVSAKAAQVSFVAV